MNLLFGLAGGRNEDPPGAKRFLDKKRFVTKRFALFSVSHLTVNLVLDGSRTRRSHVSNGRVRTRSFFREPFFCPAVIMDEFLPTGLVMGESGNLRKWNR